jgi:hypothetical protein
MRRGFEKGHALTYRVCRHQTYIIKMCGNEELEGFTHVVIG